MPYAKCLNGIILIRFYGSIWYVLCACALFRFRSVYSVDFIILRLLHPTAYTHIHTYVCMYVCMCMRMRSFTVRQFAHVIFSTQPNSYGLLLIVNEWFGSLPRYGNLYLCIDAHARRNNSVAYTHWYLEWCCMQSTIGRSAQELVLAHTATA